MGRLISLLFFWLFSVILSFLKHVCPFLFSVPIFEIHLTLVSKGVGNVESLSLQERKVVQAGSEEDATKALAMIHEQLSTSRFGIRSLDKGQQQQQQQQQPQRQRQRQQREEEQEQQQPIPKLRIVLMNLIIV